ncbi:MAG: 1-deoxy-D-xylulose-5-phosphate reductoisomerase [Chloroflexi bacterium]|nr:1-deoxy-D-xylulose-5-phosphate reductoisomerase [Chloroflexota bacterium]
MPFVPRRGRTGRIRVAVLGSTGSVGRQALDLMADHPDVFEVVALAAGRNIPLLAYQALQVRPRVVCATGGDGSPTDPTALRDEVALAIGGDGFTILAGNHELASVATMPEADVVLAATSGRGALSATLAALDAGKDVALANKESLVIAGPLVVESVRRTGGRLFPVDSEHSAIWQCLFGEVMDGVRRLVLTASGGPFREWDTQMLRTIGVADALRHPTWQMGPKITIDSATLMNKGLEAIEAHWLFGVPFDRIDIVVHPTSIVHSLVEFVDGSLKAQLGWPDMRLPIQLALTAGERLVRKPSKADPASRPFSLAELGSLPFQAPSYDRFPCLGLALEAGRTGGTAPAILSAADEVAVDAFLNRGMRFGAIAEVISETLGSIASTPVTSLEQVVAVDAHAREVAARLVQTLG